MQFGSAVAASLSFYIGGHFAMQMPGDNPRDSQHMAEQSYSPAIARKFLVFATLNRL